LVSQTTDINPVHTAHSDFLAFVGDDPTHDVVRNYAESVGFPSSIVQLGDVNTLTHLLEESQRLPKIILIDIDGEPDALNKLVRVIEALEGISKIIAVGSTNDVNLFRGLLSAGAVDYVIKPLTMQSVTLAFQNAEKALAAAHLNNTDTAGKVITFIGARGGIGTSFTAVNTAWFMAHRLGYFTSFFDLDLQYGTAALALDLVPGRGLREALETPGRLDSLLIASSMVPESEKLSLLSTEEPIDENVLADSSAVTAITAELRKNFQYTIVDLPRYRIATQKKLLAESDVIVIVAEQTLAAIRDVVRIKTALKAIAPQVRMLYVMNRISSARSGERAAQVDKPTFERAIQDKITLTIPEDPAPVALAANRGQPLGKIAPDSAIATSTLQLAEMLVGRKALKPKSNSWFSFKKSGK